MADNKAPEKTSTTDKLKKRIPMGRHMMMPMDPETFAEIKELSQLHHDHFLETADKFNGYRKECAGDFRTTLDDFHHNVMETIDKGNQVLKDNSRLISSLAKTATIPLVVGIVGISAMMIQRGTGYKIKTNSKKGTEKITMR